MLWRWLVRRYRVEVALWKCWRWARRWDGDRYSAWYCYHHSWFVRNYEMVLIYGVIMVIVLGYSFWETRLR